MDKWAWKFCMVISVSIAVLIGFATWSCNEVNKLAISNGYHQGMGWQK